MASELTGRNPTGRRGSERRSTIAVGIVVLVCLIATLAVAVALGRAGGLALPAPTTTVMLLLGFVLFLSARRRIVS